MSWRLWPLPELCEYLEMRPSELAARLDPVRDIYRRRSINPCVRHERALELIAEQYEDTDNAN